MEIPLEEIRKLPHIYCEDMRGRLLPLHALFGEDCKWHIWFLEKNTLKEFQPVNLVEGNYYAKDRANMNDILFPFLEFLNKRASWPHIKNILDGVTSDIYNLSSSIEKVEILLQENKSSGKDIRRMVGTELEYIFITCRSLFDSLQKIIASLWRRVNVQNRRPLPPSFADVALKGDNLISSEDIKKKYFIPPELIRIYTFNAPFFQWLKDYRDKIEHEGKEFNLIFITKKGPVIDVNKSPFNQMPIWTSTNMIDEKLGSVKSIINYLISKTIDAFDSAVDFFKTKIPFPADVVPNHKMYTRGIYNKHLINIRERVSNPW